MELKFIENHRTQLVTEIEALLAEASEVCFAVAFVRESGVNLILQAIRNARSRGAAVRVLFGSDWALTEANAIRTLVQLGVDVKCYSSSETFHPKGYLFRRADHTAAIVGSSNLSASGLTSGREWNLFIDSAAPVMDEFNRLWNSNKARPVTDDLLHRLEQHRPPPDFREMAQKEDQPPQLPLFVDEPAPATVAMAAPVQFSFTVNKLFRSYSNYPITVPKVFYPRLRAKRLDRGELMIVFGNAPILNALMYSGTAGYGPYYQIRMSGRDDHPLFMLPLGASLRVQLERSDDTSRVSIAVL